MKRYERQTLLVAAIAMAFSDLPTATQVANVELPAGAVVDSAYTNVLVASNGGTADVIDIGTSGSANAYHNDLDAKTVARTAFTTLPAGQLAAKLTIYARRTEGGTAATVGSFLFVVKYFVVGRTTEIYGKLDGDPTTIGD